MFIQPELSLPDFLPIKPPKYLKEHGWRIIGSQTIIQIVYVALSMASTIDNYKRTLAG